MTRRREQITTICLAKTEYVLWLAFRRAVHDVVHEVAAVGSRSVEKAQNFIDREVKDKSTKAYGSYDEVFADKVSHLLYLSIKYDLSLCTP